MIMKYLSMAILQDVYSLSFLLQQKYPNPLVYERMDQLNCPAATPPKLVLSL